MKDLCFNGKSAYNSRMKLNFLSLVVLFRQANSFGGTVNLVKIKDRATHIQRMTAQEQSATTTGRGKVLSLLR